MTGPERHVDSFCIVLNDTERSVVQLRTAQIELPTQLDSARLSSIIEGCCEPYSSVAGETRVHCRPYDYVDQIERV